MLWNIGLGAALLILGFLVWLLAPRRTATRPISPPIYGQRTMEDVRRLVNEGHKIEAIKIYRSIHGVGLREAKDAIDGMRP